MKVTHLFHSGILVETENRQIFFDAVSDISELIDIGKEVFFFVSHSHPDHFAQEIFRYRGPGTFYILSDDIETRGDDILMVKENNNYEYRGIKISTYASTDLGVAFMVNTDGKSIFHAGDLNWWHWENDSEEARKQEGHSFREIADSIPVKIDIAFIPADPRLGDAYFWAVEYFLQNKDIGHLIPVHFGDNFEITGRLRRQLGDKRIITVERRNQPVLEQVSRICT
jgi:L-ascorbate metabolism protein UlaG (beta-lactamase superfamily)